MGTQIIVALQTTKPPHPTISTLPSFVSQDLVAIIKTKTMSQSIMS